MKTKLKICTGCEEEKIIWKSVGKREKYCKECWYKKEKPKQINKVSEKKKKELDEYSKKRKAFLALNSTCQARLQNCTYLSTDVHHKAGRIGDNMLNMNTWLAVCRNCHSIIENNPILAKEMGFSKSRLNE